jgi:hypothetical protein
MLARECGNRWGSAHPARSDRRSSQSWTHDGERAFLFDEDLSSYAAEFARERWERALSACREILPRRLDGAAWKTRDPG